MTINGCVTLNKAKKRKTGIDILGDVSWGTHFCLFYQNKQDLTDILVPYFRAGLENNEFCMWITSESLNAENAIESLKQAIPDIDVYIQKGQIEILSHSDWYTKSGSFEAENVLQGWIKKHDQAMENGFAGMRVTGNTAWLEKRDWNNFTNHGIVFNNHINRYQMLALCAYALDKCNAPEIIDVVYTHQFALIKREGAWQIIESSDRKKIYEEAAQSKNIFKTLVEHIPKKIFVKDRDFVYRFSNQNYARDLKITPEQIVGRTDYDFYPKELAEKYQTDDKRIIETGGTEDIEEKYIENSEEKWIHTVKTPFRNSKGHIIGVLGIFRDITERKQAEERQRKLFDTISKRMKELRCLYRITTSLKKCRTLEEIFQNTVNVIPLGWHYEQITRAMVCFEGAEYVSAPFEPSQWKQSSDIMINNERCGSIHVYYIEERPPSDEGPFLKEERDLIDGIAQVISEAVEHKQAEAQLEVTHDKLIKASRVAGMSEIATNILHNVGNVLNSINVSAHSIRETILNSRTNNLRKVVDMIFEHADTLGTFLTEDERGKHIPWYLVEAAKFMADEQADIIEKIQSLTKNLEHVKQIIQSQQRYARAGGFEVVTSINEIIDNAVQINKEDLVRQEVNLRLELTELPKIHIDKQRAIQILVNLISNSQYALSKSQKQEKLLTLRSYQHGEDRLRIEVADNGIGISKENMTRLFQHGFTTKEKGHGFGLHSSFLAAQEMSGSLTAHSDGPEHGATFILDLPFKHIRAKQ